MNFGVLYATFRYETLSGPCMTSPINSCSGSAGSAGFCSGLETPFSCVFTGKLVGLSLICASSLAKLLLAIGGFVAGFGATEAAGFR